MTTADDKDALSVREQIARIDQMLLSMHKTRQEITFAPWQIMLAAITTAISLAAAGAGLLAAGVALGKFMS